MPILEVQIVVRAEEQLPPGLAQNIADRAGEIFSSQPGGTWVKVTRQEREDYAENGAVLDEGIQPVFVRVVKARRPPMEQLQDEVDRLTSVLAHLLSRPHENIHIIYEPEARGRVAFGGKLVE